MSPTAISHGDNHRAGLNVFQHFRFNESAFDVPIRSQEDSMKPVFMTVAILAVLLLAVPAFAQGDAAAGKEIFSKKCASCHGAAGEGKESVAKMMKVELRPLGSKEVQARSDADLKKDILQGKGKMKPVAGVDAKAADDVVAYMRTLKK